MTHTSGQSADSSVAGLRGRLRGAIARRAAIDRRALAAFRIGLGGLLLIDLGLRSRDLVFFYTDRGALPRSALAETYPFAPDLSLHAASGAAWWQGTLFVVAGVAAVTLLLGYRTRLATVVSLGLLVSLHARNPLVLNGGDALFRRLLFWSIFLPLGSRWAVNAGAPTAEGRGDRVASLASAALLVQVMVVYAVNAIFKHRGDAWTSGRAVEQILSLDGFTVFLGPAVAGSPELLTAGTYAWLWLLTAAPLLLLLTGRARTLLAGLFIAGQVGIGLTLDVGLFPVISIVGLLPFLHGGVWDRVERGPHWIRGSTVGGWLACRIHRSGWQGDPRWAPLRRRVTSRTGRPNGRLPQAASRWGHRGCQAAILCALVLALTWNGVTLGYVPLPDDDLPVDRADRSWSMFAPAPPGVDGWYVVVGTRSSGGTVDALQGGPVDWDRPPNPARTYPNNRWRKYLTQLRWEHRGLHAEFGDALCKRWGRRHDADLAAVRIVFVAQDTVLDGPEPTRLVDLGRYRC
jgi:hypothetical protein